MARPQKNNCEYFSHDADMRNHRKVKAIRQKFANGYAIWNMFLEVLTDCNFNKYEPSDIEYELLSGDFGFSATEIREVVDYCLSIELLFEDEIGLIYSKTMNERLASVHDKRKRSKEFAEQQRRERGVFVGRKTVETVVSATETPQSKVKEIKVNESKVLINIEPPTAAPQLSEKLDLEENPLKEKPENPIPKKEPETLHPKMMSAYFDFFKKTFFMEPKIDGAQGKALNDLKNYFTGTCKRVFIEKEKREPTQAELDDRVLIAWKTILDSWDRLDHFTSQQTKLSQIASNIQNIIIQIKTPPKNHVNQSQKSSSTRRPEPANGKGFGSLSANAGS